MKDLCIICLKFLSVFFLREKESECERDRSREQREKESFGESKLRRERDTQHV